MHSITTITVATVQQWLIGAGQGIIQSSSALGETARSLVSCQSLKATAIAPELCLRSLICKARH